MNGQGLPFLSPEDKLQEHLDCERRERCFRRDVAVSGYIAEADPSPETMADLTRRLRRFEQVFTR